jgi:hypothetical protein
MKATVRDISALAAIKPLEVAAYLRASGWRQVTEASQRWATWLLKQGSEEFEIGLPLDDTLRDFVQRMGDVLATLEAVEERSQLEIIRDLLVGSADVVRLRLADKELADGSVPIDDGAQFVQRTRDLVLAAACATVSPRVYYPSRKPNQAVEYVRKARLGQTEQGSFVVTVISRVAPSLVPASGQLFEAEEPFERRVIETLANSLSAVRRAAESAVSTGGVSSFVEAVPRGVSANLCDAIVGMFSTGESTRGVEFDFTWSRSRPQTDSAIPHKVILPSDVVPIIGEASRYFKETSPREEFELRGAVVKLERAEGSPTGRITVLGFVDEQLRRISIELNDPEYHKAVGAHDQERPVVCYGQLMREGKSHRLLSPYDFSVESDN